MAASALSTQETSGLSLNWLVRPHPTITDDLERSRARLLGIIMLVILVLGGGIVGYYVISDPTSVDDADTQLAMVAWGVTLITYLILRTGRVRIATTLHAATLFVVFALIPFVPNARDSLIFFGLVPVLVAAIFFRARTVVIVAAGYVAFTLTRSFFPADITQSQVVDGNLFIVFASGLVVTFMNHFRGMENIRRAELEEANEKLRESEALLEQRVLARTRDLTIASQVAQQTTRVLNLTSLLPELVEHTRKGFDLYVVSLFLYNEDTEHLDLAASTGEAGRIMLKEGKTFHIDDRPGLVPQAARQRNTLVIDNVQDLADHLPNPLLPFTRSEMVVPMMVGDRLVGVLDLQSNIIDRFSSEDSEILSTLAEQMAIAVRNAQLYQEAEVARDEAEEANRTKSRFLANMSHELRTPLNAILNFTEFVADGVYGDINEQQEEALRQTLSSGEHLLSVINDVLDLTKIEAGMMELFIEEVDVNQELASAISIGKGLVKDKPIVFDAEIDELPHSYGDRRRLRQVFLNLVSNATKFTGAGRISVTATAGDDMIQIAVTDTGVGIAPEDQNKVFESFKQAKHDLTGAVGTGLGMPISKHFVEMHRGRIWFKSTPGIGSTFYVVLPVLTRQEADEASKSVVQAA